LPDIAQPSDGGAVLGPDSLADAVASGVPRWQPASAGVVRHR
jgi:hypothetical protein